MEWKRKSATPQLVNNCIWKETTIILNTHLVQLDDVRVVQHLHDLNFPVNLLQVDSIQLGLVNNLNGYLQQNQTWII